MNASIHGFFLGGGSTADFPTELIVVFPFLLAPEIKWPSLHALGSRSEAAIVYESHFFRAYVP
jgi:hypothetical protein